MIQLRKWLGAGMMLLIVTMVLATFAYAQEDVTPPTVFLVSPLDNAVSVASDVPITVIFSEEMDPSTINTRTIRVEQHTAGTPESVDYKTAVLETTVSYEDLTATLTPVVLDASNGDIFTVTITADVRDLAGNPLAEEHEWRYTTGNTPLVTAPDTSALVATGQVAETTAPPDAAPVSGQWLWAVAGLLAVILIAILFAISREPRPMTRKRPSAFGDAYPVSQLPAIGDRQGDLLRSIGIRDTHQLWESDPVKVARSIKADVNDVRHWQHMAELAAIKGIGPHYAHLLDRAGVHGIDQLKHSNPDKIIAIIRRKQEAADADVQGPAPGHDAVEHWINEAKQRRFGET